MRASASPSTVIELRERIARLEGRPRRAKSVLPFGIPVIDSRLPGGGLARGALHEVAGGGNGAIDGAAAALFAAGVAGRTAGKALWWPCRRSRRLCRGRRRQGHSGVHGGRPSPWRSRRRRRRDRQTADDGIAPAPACRRRHRIDRRRAAPLASAQRCVRLRRADRRHDPLARLRPSIRAAAGSGRRPPSLAGRVDPRQGGRKCRF